MPWRSFFDRVQKPNSIGQYRRRVGPVKRYAPVSSTTPEIGLLSAVEAVAGAACLFFRANFGWRLRGSENN